MIRYALACDRDHEFESWFPSSDAYDAQRARGLVECPLCGSAKVEKQIMAPRVARTDKGTGLGPGSGPSLPVPVPAPAGPDIRDAPAAPQPVAMFSEKERELRAMVKALREHVEKHAEHVGGRFPDEARRMHYGEIEHRSIYGEASPGEARELIEEGIEIHPLPIVPDERN
ncbi:MAG TPA: DUF1178 family protein [Beijerinckiaceae bacterium]|jgi:hypothetical protein